MNQTVDSRKYYPTALVLYITYFVLGIAASIMGQYKQDFAAMWDAAVLTDGSYDVSGVVAVIAAIGLGWLIAFPVAGPLSDRLGRRLSALVGYALYAVFLLAVTFSPNLYVGYALAIVSGMANSFLDTSITPSCMEIFKEKGTIANIFTGLSISIARFLLPFVISFVAVRKLPFRTIFLATAALIIVDGVFLAFLPFPSFEWTVKAKDAPKERMQFTPSAVVLVCLGFTTSTTFMLWINCNQELGALYGLTDPSRIQSFYSVGIVLALFASATLLKRNVEPAKTLVAYPTVALATLVAIYLVQEPVMCLAGSFLLGFFAAGGVLQLVTAVANEMFPKKRGVITSVVMIASSVANYLVVSVAGVLTRIGGIESPQLVLLFNMAVMLNGILLALYLNVSLKRERPGAVEAAAAYFKRFGRLALVVLHQLKRRLPAVKVAVINDIPCRPGSAAVIQSKRPSEFPAAALNQLQVGGRVNTLNGKRREAIAPRRTEYFVVCVRDGLAVCEDPVEGQSIVIACLATLHQVKRLAVVRYIQVKIVSGRPARLNMHQPSPPRLIIQSGWRTVVRIVSAPS